ncbi:hypothetical protein [Ekhidna sp.]
MPSLCCDLRKNNLPYDREMFLDTNVLLFIYGPFVDGKDVRTVSYSNLLKHCLENDIRFYINHCVVSEFSNVYIRENYKIDSSNGVDLEFKEYRKTERYKEVIVNLTDEWYHILEDCKICETSICVKDVAILIDKMPERLMDFNDEIISFDCIKNKFVLVPHDSDFSTHPDIEVVTGNRKLVEACA